MREKSTGGETSRQSAKIRRARRARRLLCVFMIWGFFGIVGVVTVAGWLLAAVSGTQKKAYGKEAASVSQTESAASDAPETQETEKTYAADDADVSLLILVNREHPLDEDYDPQLRSICGGRLQASEVLYEDLTDMLSDAADAGYSYWIASAYRSRERQQELVDEDVAAYVAAGLTESEALEKTYEQTNPAGCSEHETGLALDILCSTNAQMDESQAQEPGNLWLREHCAQYGFILRYPEGKEAVTGIDYEPWHFRYVGKSAAAYLTEHELVLEDIW